MTPNDAVDAVTDASPQDMALAQPEPSTTSGENASPEHTHAHTHGPTLNPELMREVAVEVPADEVSRTYSRIIKRYQKLARIPGFRAGKVPESLIRKRFAKDLRQEVMDQLVQERFRTEMETQNLNPISQPQITELNLNDGQPLRFRAQFEVLPEIDLSGYDAVTVEKPHVAVDESEYDAELDRLLDSHATVETVEEDRALQDGDWAEISFKGTRQNPAETVTEGEPPAAAPEQEVNGEDVLVEVGGKNTLPAFNEALRGRRVKEEFSLEVEYPKDFGDLRLAGQTIHYDVTVGAIKRKQLPERDADFAKLLGDYDSWDGFTSKLREDLTTRKTQGAEMEAKGHLVDALVGRFQFPVPESFVQQQIDVRLERGLRALAQQGMPEEQMRRMDFPRLREAQREEAVKEVKASLLLDRIADTEGVQVSEDDVERELMMLSIQSREPLETMRERLSKDGTLARIREQMLREQTATRLYEKLA